MNKFLNSNDSGMALMVIATSLCDKYDEWITDPNILNVVDLQKNSICVGLKQLYPTINDKITQSIALAFTMYFVLAVQEVNSNFIDYSVD